MSNARLTKADCVQLRQQLVNLGAGQAERESNEDFVRRLYPIRDHLRAFAPEVVLIVGPRGAGKSELFRAFFSGDLPLGALSDHLPLGLNRLSFEALRWKAVYPYQVNFPDSRELARVIDSEQRARDLWYAMLVRRLSDEFDAENRDALGSILKPQATQLPEIFRALETIEVNPTTALDALERRLEQEDRWLFVGYDELDTLGPFDWNRMVRLVRGLLSFWADYGRRWRRIRAKIFLRSDLFRHHGGMGSADFAKLSANRAELLWSDADLLAMLVKRIANTSDGLQDYCVKARIQFQEEEVLGAVPKFRHPGEGYRLLERLAGMYMGANKKKGFVRNWVLDHLRDGSRQIAPRTLVHLIERSAGMEAPNSALRPPRLIHPTALRQALDVVSKDHVQQGISSEWPWLEGVKTRLSSRPLVPWERRELESLFAEQWEGYWGRLGLEMMTCSPRDTPSALVDYLMELGIFRLRSDDRIDVSDLYRFGLDLRRKGGVKIGRSSRRNGR